MKAKKRISVLLAVACLLLATVGLATGQSSAPSPRIANYDVEVTLDVAEKMLRGRSQLHWRNTSTDTIRRMPFHLYYNAFKNSQSSLLREWYKLPPYFSQQLQYDGEWGWIDLLTVVDEGGRSLLDQHRYLQPDDQNTADRTVIEIDLAEALLPGDSLRLDFTWEARIPRSMLRSGYNKDFYFIAQWYPKIGVYESPGTRYAERGQWNCHQYHLKGEFYADHGIYNVAITVPQDYQVGATGIAVDEQVLGSSKGYRFRAEDVSDFAWTASPHLQVQEAQWADVRLRYLSYPDHAYMGERYFAVLKYCLQYFEDLLGPYPYPQLTIVEPPFHGLFAMAMEYPTLITVGSFGFLPRGIHTAETLAAHEFIHQYFMHLIASNETEEPWLDEGLTTYFEARMMDEYYAQQNSAVIDLLGVRVHQKDLNWNTYAHLGNPKIAENDRAAWEYPNGGYEYISYKKSGVWLWTLEGFIGRPSMDRVLKTYFQRWRFGHPCARDFIAIVNEVVREDHGDRLGENLNWYFDQVLHTTAACDYKVSYVGNFLNLPPMGKDVVVDSSAEAGSRYLSKVVIQRVEEMQLPVEIEFTFFDGHVERRQWDGRARSVNFFFSRDYGVRSAEIDPERKNYLDINYLNNSYTYVPDRVAVRYYVGRCMVWMQQVLQTVVALV